MTGAVALFMLLSVLSAACLGGVTMLSWRVLPETMQPQLVRWLTIWAARGWAFPVLAWAMMNLGLSWSLPPFMPEVQAAQVAGTGWFAAWVRVLSFGLFIVSSYWAAATLAWALSLAARGLAGETRSNFRGLCLTATLGMMVPAALLLALGGWATLGLAVLAVLAPIAGYAPSVLKAKKTPPIYARAIARMKFGKYSEAEWEIIRELEKSEDDFDGWMMLAELYAVHFKDLVQAEQTILEICDQPRTTPSQVSVALHRLADWHLKISGNPDAARRALQVICDRLCGTHLARMAQLRLAQMPQTERELREQQHAAPIPLPALGDHAGEAPRLDRKEAAQAANECVERLKRDPNHVPAREKLARLFAEHLDQANLGLEQLALLLDMPDQPDPKRAEWLSLSASWHLRLRQDKIAGRKLLDQLIRDFPDSPQAFAARRKIVLLDRGEA